MFDQQHGHIALVANPADQIAKHVDLFVIEAAGGFIEQQDLRIGCQRARQFDALLGPERQAGNREVGNVIEVKIAENLMNALVECGLAAANPGQFQRVAHDVAVGAGMGADPDVVEHGKIWKQSDVLEGAADADFGDPVRRPLQDALAFHQDVALARLIEPAQAIEERGLASAVWPDQPQDLPLIHVERNTIQRNDAAEHDADVANRKQGRLSLRELVPASSRPAQMTRRAVDHANGSAARNDDGYLIPSTTRATFPPVSIFCFLAFFDCGAAPPSAVSMFLTIATRRGPISLRNRSSVKRNAGAPQLNA